MNLPVAEMEGTFKTAALAYEATDLGVATAGTEERLGSAVYLVYERARIKAADKTCLPLCKFPESFELIEAEVLGYASTEAKQ